MATRPKRAINKKRPWRATKAASFAVFGALGRLSPDADLVLQPWFLPNEVSLAIRTLIPVIHVRKMRFYFDDYGCIRCRKKKVLYGNNGFCDRCLQRITYRVLNSLKKRLDSKQAELPDDGNIFVDGMTKAQRLIQRNTKRRYI